MDKKYKEYRDEGPKPLSSPSCKLLGLIYIDL